MKRIKDYLKVAGYGACCLLCGGISAQASDKVEMNEVDGVYYMLSDYADEEVSHAIVVSPSMDPVTGQQPHYAGDLVIAPQVEIGGETYDVEDIYMLAFQHSPNLKSLDIPFSINTIQDYAFNNCGLDSIEIPIPVRMGERLFEESNIRKIRFKSNQEGGCEYQFFGGHFLGNHYVEEIEVDPCDTIRIGVMYGRVDKLHFRHLDYIYVDGVQFNEFFGFSGAKYVVMDDQTPPVAELTCDDPEMREKCVMDQTLLFVPDGSEELYRNAAFWNTFYVIYPQSRLGEIEDLLSGIEVPSNDAGINLTIENRTLTVAGLNGLSCVVCDIYGRIYEGTVGHDCRWYELPAGIYIVSCGEKAFKVAVK